MSWKAVVLITLLVAVGVGLLRGASLVGAQACVPVVAHWEITQAIQDDNNSVPLFDRRGTTIRTYWKLPATHCSSAINFSAELRAEIDGIQVVGALGRGVDPDLGEKITVDTLFWNSQHRLSESRSLDFTFTPDIGSVVGGGDGGDIDVAVCAKPSDQSSDCTQEGQWEETTVTFIERPAAPRIMGYDIDYKAKGAAPRSLTASPEGDRWIRAIYPFGSPSDLNYYTFANAPPIKFNLDLEDISSNEGTLNHWKLLRELNHRIFCDLHWFEGEGPPNGNFANPDHGYGWINSESFPPLSELQPGHSGHLRLLLVREHTGWHFPANRGSTHSPTNWGTGSTTYTVEIRRLQSVMWDGTYSVPPAGSTAGVH